LERGARGIVTSPVVWGAIASVAFFAPILTGAWDDPFIHRYFAGHPVNIIETVAFFIALFALLIKGLQLVFQSQAMSAISLGPSEAGGQTMADCRRLAELVDQIPAGRQQDYLVRRLRDGLAHILRVGSADAIEDELKYLSDLDASRAHSSYALVRIVVWAIPILGFLGTVVGITMAIASLSPDDLEKSLPEVTAGLGVAFDTTALALALSMVLMFTQFVIDKFEGRLLSRVDERATIELGGRFVQLGGHGDPQVAAVRRMAEAVIQTSDKLVARQAELWQGTIETAHGRWNEISRITEQQLETVLIKGLDAALTRHVERIAAVEQSFEERNRQHWQKLHETLVAATGAITSQQRELTRQGEILKQVVDATGQVAKLEETLNRNLASLSGAHHFEETLLSLSAAIHLLSARLGSTSAPSVDLQKLRSESRAA
jgi:biopolymer transport protein ExbB/TolQ